jgi:hypothetical protein
VSLRAILPDARRHLNGPKVLPRGTVKRGKAR